MITVLFGPPGTAESRELRDGILIVRCDETLGVPADLPRGCKVLGWWPERDDA
jgi:hypothetical protein